VRSAERQGGEVVFVCVVCVFSTGDKYIVMVEGLKLIIQAYYDYLIIRPGH